MSEVWHFENSTQYDKRAQCGGLFASYIDAFMRIKQEASGYPSTVRTEAERQGYVDAYFEHEGIRLDPDKIEKNPGMRAIAKGVINVIWGKFAERENLKQTKFIKTMGELLDMFRDSAINVKDLIIHNEDVIEVHFNNNDGFVEHNVNTNIIVASFTTALACLKLYTVLEQLDDRVLYHDTDSVVFRTDSTVEHLDPSTGGTFSVSSPTKSMTPGKNSYKLGCVRMVRERKITRDVKTKTVHTTDTKKDYRVVFTKRVRLRPRPRGHTRHINRTDAFMKR